MNGLLVGVDAGGTSTRALAFDPQTGESRTARREGANWTVHGPDLCRERLGGAVAEAAGSRPILSLALCIAGYYPPDHQQTAEAWARATWPDVPHLSIQTDVHAAWAGAFGGEPGIVVISGTGSIAYGRNAAGEEARAGGWGPLFGDQGSAYDLGLHTLRCLAGAVDWGVGYGDEVGELLIQEWPELGSDLRSWLRGIYRCEWGREQIAVLGGFVAKHADAGSEGCISLVGGITYGLCTQVWQVRSALGLDEEEGTRPKVALVGGLGENSLTLRRIFQERLAAGEHRLHLVPARHSGLEGAAILAALDAGLTSPELKRGAS